MVEFRLNMNLKVAPIRNLKKEIMPKLDLKNAKHAIFLQDDIIKIRTSALKTEGNVRNLKNELDIIVLRETNATNKLAAATGLIEQLSRFAVIKYNEILSRPDRLKDEYTNLQRYVDKWNEYKNDADKLDISALRSIDGATFEGSITGSKLTVTTLKTGTLQIGHVIIINGKYEKITVYNEDKTYTITGSNTTSNQYMTSVNPTLLCSSLEDYTLNIIGQSLSDLGSSVTTIDFFKDHKLFTNITYSECKLNELEAARNAYNKNLGKMDYAYQTYINELRTKVIDDLYNPPIKAAH